MEGNMSVIYIEIWYENKGSSLAWYGDWPANGVVWPPDIYYYYHASLPSLPLSLSLECPMLGLVPTVTLHSQSAMRGQVCTWCWSPAPWSLTEEGWENPPRVSISSLSFLGFLSQCDSVTPCQLGTMVWCGNTTHLYSLREPHKQLILMKILQYNILLLQKKLLKMPALPFWILSSYEHN